MLTETLKVFLKVRAQQISYPICLSNSYNDHVRQELNCSIETGKRQNADPRSADHYLRGPGLWTALVDHA